MSSRSLVNVDWSKMSSKYDETLGTRTASGIRAPSITGAYNWIVDFVTANFQRKSFLYSISPNEKREVPNAHHILYHEGLG